MTSRIQAGYRRVVKITGTTKTLEKTIVSRPKSSDKRKVIENISQMPVR